VDNSLNCWPDSTSPEWRTTSDGYVETRRLNRNPKGNDPEALAARLPADLRSFDAWYYDDNGKPTGLQDYLTALAAQVAPHEPMPVMNSAGLSEAEWYRTMLSQPITASEPLTVAQRGRWATRVYNQLAEARNA
jgi:hypothetical protein